VVILPRRSAFRRGKGFERGVRLSRLVEQFMRNYVDFANEKGKEPSLPE